MAFLDIPGVADDALAVLFNEDWDTPRLLLQSRTEASANRTIDARIFDLAGVSVEAVDDAYEAGCSDGTRDDERAVVKYNGPTDKVCIQGVAEGSVGIDYEKDPAGVRIYTTPSDRPSATPSLPMTNE